MKRILTITFLLICAVSYSQQYTNNPAWGVGVKRFVITEGDTVGTKLGVTIISGVLYVANGTKWTPVGTGGSSLPPQTGNNGKYLKTNGTSASWQLANLLDSIDYTNAGTATVLRVKPGGSGLYKYEFALGGGINTLSVSDPLKTTGTSTPTLSIDTVTRPEGLFTLGKWAKDSAAIIASIASKSGRVYAGNGLTNVNDSTLRTDTSTAVTGTATVGYALNLHNIALAAISQYISDSLGALTRLRAGTSAGVKLLSNSGATVAEYGLGGGTNFDFHGFAGYDANRSSSYTARSFVDFGFADSALNLRVKYSDTTNRTLGVRSNARAIGDSNVFVKNYVQLPTGKTVGNIFTDAFTRTSLGSNYTTTLPNTTVQMGGSRLTLVGGNNDSLNFIRYNWNTCSENYTTTVKYVNRTLGSNSKGIEFGLYSINQYGYAHHNRIGLYQAVGAANRGVVFFTNPTTTYTTVGTGTISTISVGDTIELTMIRNKYTYTFYAKNLATSEMSIGTIVHNPAFGATTFAPNNTANPAIWNYNSSTDSLTVTSFSYTLNDQLNPEMANASNSIGLGQGATSLSNRWASLYYNNTYQVVNSSGGADVSQNIVDRLPELKLLKPKYFVLQDGGNDVLFGVPIATTMANLQKIRDSLVSWGTQVIHAAPTPRNSTNEKPLRDSIYNRFYPQGDIVVTASFDSLANGTALLGIYDCGDGVHPNNAGHARNAAMIQASLPVIGLNQAAYTGVSNSVSGSDTYVQYNNAGSFGSSANFTYDNSATTLQVKNTTTTGVSYINTQNDLGSNFGISSVGSAFSPSQVRNRNVIYSNKGILLLGNSSSVSGGSDSLLFRAGGYAETNQLIIKKDSALFNVPVRSTSNASLASLTVTSLTANRIPFITTGGSMVTSTNFTFDSTTKSIALIGAGSTNNVRFSLKNTTASGDAQLAVVNDANSIGLMFLTGSTYSPYKPIGANSLGFYKTGSSGNIAILNDANGDITLTTNGNSTAQWTLNSSGNVVQTGTNTATQYRLSALNTAPASASATGTTGEVRITSDYIYVCIATNTWVRAALATW